VGIFEHIWIKRFGQMAARCLIASAALVSLTLICYRLRFNVATCGFLYVIVVVLVSRTGDLVSSLVASIIAALCLAYLAPPAHSFRVDDPLDVVAIVAFLCTSLIIARLLSKLRRMAEEALSSVNRKLIDSEEQERARIARDLQDDIGQRMALLEVKLDQLRTDVPNPTFGVLNAMHELRKEAGGISTDINALAHALHSPKLEHLGLVKTMRTFCKEFAQRREVEIDFRSDGLPTPPSQDVALSLFRVLQEALHNSAKHSGVRRFEVELFEASHAVHLIVRDSGFGFNPEAAMKGSGLGLISMQERIKLVKGVFSIDSQLKRGTTIHAKVPIRPRSNFARAAG